MSGAGSTQVAIHSAGGTSDRLLTARERQIVVLITGGSTNKEIARRLAITERTVKAHLTSIFRKLELSSRLQLGIHAVRSDIRE